MALKVSLRSMRMAPQWCSMKHAVMSKVVIISWLLQSHFYVDGGNVPQLR